jgi:GTP-binding protein
VLLSELEKFNPELLDKRRLLAITMADMLDEQMMNEMRELLPKDLNTVFISAVTQMNIDQLKDTLWQMMNKE